MKVTIMVADMVLLFRLIVMERSNGRPQIWDLEVFSIEEVAEILVSLHFLDPEPAALLASASKTITPQQGIYTIPLSALASLTELFYPEDEPASIEAQETNVLMAQGEITEEALAAAGFVSRVNGRLQ